MHRFQTTATITFIEESMLKYFINLNETASFPLKKEGVVMFLRKYLILGQLPLFECLSLHISYSLQCFNHTEFQGHSVIVAPRRNDIWV